MKNRLIINVKGKNINNFINKLSKNKIELYKIKYINNNEANITIKEKDYKYIEKNKTIYEINILNYKGIPKLKNTIKNNIFLIIFILFGLSILLLLTNTIFKVEIIHNEENIRNLIKTELRLYDIEEYKLIKTFKQIEQIKKQILEKYKDKIEWLEIERIGTKYEVRLELRKQKEQNQNNQIYNIVSKKDAIIKKIEAISGEKTKNINDYVKKGDIVISSNITLNQNIMGNISANGKIYGEVWYQVNSEYPFVYKEEIITGKTKTTYGIKFLNKTYTLDLKPYKDKKTTITNIITNTLLPISFIKQKEEEIKIIDEINTIEDATNKAIKLAKKRIEEDLTDKEYVISSKVLSQEIKDSKIECVVFFTVYEDITEYVLVEE